MRVEFIPASQKLYHTHKKRDVFQVTSKKTKDVLQVTSFRGQGECIQRMVELQ